MTVKHIEKQLRQALLYNEKMVYALYEYELEELVDDFKKSLINDDDDYIFAVTVIDNDVAMVLIDRELEIHINETARDKLREFWQAPYSANIKKLIPIFAKQLQEGVIPVNGIHRATGLLA